MSAEEDRRLSDLDAPPRYQLRQRLVWPGLVFLLLGGQICLLLVTVYLATRDPSFAVEPNYYQQALHWNDIMAQRRENARLGWTVAWDVREEGDASGERTLRCSLCDRAGRSLGGARIELLAFAHARAHERFTAVLSPAKDGDCSAQVRLRRGGIWEFRLAVRRGPDSFTDVQQLQLK